MSNNNNVGCFGCLFGIILFPFMVIGKLGKRYY